MKRFSLSFIFIIHFFLIKANDGVYLSKGGVIYPMKETKISLEKEILSFKIIDKIAYVNINFEFNNPENTTRKLLIGFQAPGAGGDVSDSIANLNQINDFTIIKDFQILKYKLLATNYENGELKSPEKYHFHQGNEGIFVYLFETEFKPGKNSIQHSYNFPASNNVSFDQIYNYILTTGSKWADSTIKDLTVNIDMGINKYFYVYDVFGNSAKWTINGTGKVTNEKFNYMYQDTCRMIRTINGSLQIRVKNLIPKKNIEFGIINEKTFTSWPAYYTKVSGIFARTIGTLELEGTYTKEELKLLRNTIYAQYGYEFKNQDLLKYFSKFGWYIPNPNLQLSEIKLTMNEHKFIQRIIELESEK